MRSIPVILAVCVLAACSGRARQAPVTNTPPKKEPTPAPQASPGDGGTVITGGDQGSTSGEQINGGSTGETTQPGETSDTDNTPATPSTSDDNTTVDPNKPAGGTATPEVKPEVTPANNASGTIEIQGASIVFQDLRFSVPEGWKVHQDTNTSGVMLMGFSKGSEYFRIYAKKAALPSLQSVFVNGSQVVNQERDEKVGDYSWKRIDTQKGQVSVAGFALLHKEHAYFGFGRSNSQQSAAAITSLFLGGMK